MRISLVFKALTIAILFFNSPMAQALESDTDMECKPEILSAIRESIILAGQAFESPSLCGPLDSDGRFDGELILEIRDGAGKSQNRRINCGEEFERLKEWNNRYNQMVSTNRCPKACSSCKILADVTAAKRVVCNGKEQEQQTIPACLADVLKTTFGQDLFSISNKPEKQTSCAVELIHGVIQNLIHNVTGLWHLVKSAASALSGFVLSSWEHFAKGLDHTADANQLLSTISESEMKSEEGIMSRVAQWPSQIAEMIQDGLMSKFGCEQWSSGMPHVGECTKPMHSFACASCAQLESVMCGGLGYLVGEITTWFVAGGTAGIVLSAGKNGAAAFGKTFLKTFPKTQVVVNSMNTATAKIAVGATSIAEKSAQKWTVFKESPIGKALDAASKTRAMKSIGRIGTVALGNAYFRAINNAAICGYDRGKNLGNKIIKDSPDAHIPKSNTSIR